MVLGDSVEDATVFKVYLLSSDMDMDIHPFVEGSFGDEVEKCITHLGQRDEQVRLQSPVHSFHL